MFTSKISYLGTTNRTSYQNLERETPSLRLVDLQQAEEESATSIPARRNPAQSIKGRNSGRSYWKNGKQDEKAYKILQVEDNAETRFIVKRYLRKVCEYDSAVQGMDALNMINQKKYDVIIMDINLGEGIDGIETTRRIRENKAYKDVPVIAVTANVTSDIKARCQEAGMDAFLAKPFYKEDLTEVIDRVRMNKAVNNS